jgi:hypothetical protein
MGNTVTDLKFIWMYLFRREFAGIAVTYDEKRGVRRISIWKVDGFGVSRLDALFTRVGVGENLKIINRRMNDRRERNFAPSSVRQCKVHHRVQTPAMIAFP